MQDFAASQIDDFIHETYLETLDERALVHELERFSEICGRVISATISDGAMIRELNRHLSQVRRRQVRLSCEGEGTNGWQAAQGPLPIRRARRIVENKNLILRAIQSVAPETAKQIQEEVTFRPQRTRRITTCSEPSDALSAPESGQRAGPRPTPARLAGAATLLLLVGAIAWVLRGFS